MTRGIDRLSTGKSPRKIEAGALAVGLALALSACGESDNTQADRPTPVETTATAEVTATPDMEISQCDESDYEMMANLVQKTLEPLRDIQQPGTWSWSDIPQAQKAETGEVLLDEERNESIEAVINRAAEVYKDAGNNPDLVVHNDGSVRRTLGSGDQVVLMMRVDGETGRPQDAFLTITESNLNGDKKVVADYWLEYQGLDLYSTTVGIGNSTFLNSSELSTPSDIRTLDKSAITGAKHALDVLKTGSTN
jgi:hypothetical protein